MWLNYKPINFKAKWEASRNIHLLDETRKKRRLSFSPLWSNPASCLWMYSDHDGMSETVAGSRGHERQPWRIKAIMQIMHLPHKDDPYALKCFPGGTSGKEPTCQCRRHKRHRFDPWVGKFPWRRTWESTPAFVPENPMDRGPWQATVHRIAESDTTEVTTHNIYVLKKVNPCGLGTRNNSITCDLVRPTESQASDWLYLV